MNSPIDIIIPWVDGTDIKWQEEKSKYMVQLVDGKANSAIRYQDWHNLHYWFRAIEKFMPWVHRIFFCHLGACSGFFEYVKPKVANCKSSGIYSRKISSYIQFKYDRNELPPYRRFVRKFHPF